MLRYGRIVLRSSWDRQASHIPLIQPGTTIIGRLLKNRMIISLSMMPTLLIGSIWLERESSRFLHFAWKEDNKLA